MLTFLSRIGLLMFTTILTIGQFIYAIGGTKNVYWVMLAGRVVFGLGGECMSVGQSAIISNWFKGKELAFALGLNLTFARLASVFGGIVIPRLITKDDNLVNSVMWTGTGLCLVSLVAGVLLVLIDRYADRTDKKELALSDDDKFQFKDILEFELPFWLVCVSCVFVYMSIFPFIQVSNTFLQEQYGFDKNLAGTLYSVPYFMSAALSPILGYMIDKVGKRAIFITTSSILVALACFISAALPTYTEPSYTCLLPLILVGFGYSIYASALWSSIPYIVKPKVIGSAFGLATSVQ
jgi:MFS family permease